MRQWTNSESGLGVEHGLVRCMNGEKTHHGTSSDSAHPAKARRFGDRIRALRRRGGQRELRHGAERKVADRIDGGIEL
jgi:hypothetical protein